MKISQGFILRKIAGQNIVVPLGVKTLDFNIMISLNDSGAFLWQQLQTDKTEDQLLGALLEEYDIDEERASEDIKRFINKLEDAEILE